MTIETKFSFGNSIWTVLDNCVQRFVVSGIKIYFSVSDDKQVKYEIRIPGSHNIYINESRCFATKEELLESM